MTPARLSELPRLAWWQAAAFARSLAAPRLAAVMLWPNFYADALIRWITASIWHNDHAVASAAHRRPVVRRAIPAAGILLAVLILIGFTALNPAVATALSVLVTVLLIWSIAGLLVLHHAAPNPKETRAARKALRRDHHGSVEIINVARAPHGRHGAARDLMAQIATAISAEGHQPVCIARSSWHQAHYTGDGWAPATGLLCTWTASTAPHPTWKSRGTMTE